MHWYQHPGKEEMKLILKHSYLDRYHERVKILSLIMQSYPWQVMVQVSCLVDSYLCNHSYPAQITHVKILTTQTQQQSTMRSQQVDVKTRWLVCRCHLEILGPQEPTLLHRCLHRLEEPKLHLHHPPRRQHPQEEHKHPLQKTTHVSR